MFKIKMAGLTVAIENQLRYVEFLYSDYLTDSESEDFKIAVSKEEILAKRSEVGENVSFGYCENLCIYQRVMRQLPLYDGILVHSAAIAVDGQAYLFLAKSGVGKTTQISLWKAFFGDRAQIINGDKPILRRMDNQWYVCGTPWQGKENWGCNTILPLKALCFIERGQENEIHPVSMEQASQRIFHQILLPDDEGQMDALFSLLENLLAEIPSYALKCNRDSDAVLIAYEGMQQS